MTLLILLHAITFHMAHKITLFYRAAHKHKLVDRRMAEEVSWGCFKQLVTLNVEMADRTLSEVSGRVRIPVCNLVLTQIDRFKNG